MHIAISGASGFVGRALTGTLRSGGHALLALSRSVDKPGERQWSPSTGPPDLKTDPPLDGIVHLAGEPVSQRWNSEVKARIRKSRTVGTRNLVDGIAALDRKPRVLVCASAIGYYGDRGDELLDEQAPPGEGFLADVCQEWEAAADRAEKFGVRVVKIRFGLVLGKDGGALQKMLLPFRLGLGAELGSGQQWVSWIHREDLARMMQFALTETGARGAWNGVAPNPVRNEEFTGQLAGALNRPAFMAVPAWVLKVGAGEMAQILLNSQRCVPEAPLAAGFQFQYPELGPALRSVLT